MQLSVSNQTDYSSLNMSLYVFIVGGLMVQQNGKLYIRSKGKYPNVILKAHPATLEMFIKRTVVNTGVKLQGGGEATASTSLSQVCLQYNNKIVS